MSASREKKQRQGGTPSDKALTAKQQADETRRKTIQYTVIGVVVAVLVAALLIWNSGFFQARSTAVTLGGTNYTAAQTSYFYHSSQSYQIARAYGSMMGYDVNKSPEDQTYTTDESTGEVTTYHDYFLQSAMEDMATITALYDAAVKDGMGASDVTAEVEEAIDSAKQYAQQNSVSYKQYLAAVYGSYVSPSVFKDCVTRTSLANKYLNAHRDSLTHTDEQLQAYYNDHSDDLDTFQYSYLYFTPDQVEDTDADGNELEMTDEAKEAAEELKLAEAKTKAEDAKKDLEDGKSLADVIAEFEPSSSDEDTQVEGKDVSTLYKEWLSDSSRKAGDVTVVENSTYGYYVVVYGERYLDETPTRATRHILIEAETTSGESAPTDEQMADAKAKADELLSQWQTGAATEDAFAELANANSSDRGSNTNGGLYDKVYKGQFVTNYDEWLFDAARKPGDTSVVENRGSYYGYHVVYYVGENPDYFKWMVESDEALTSEEIQDWLDGLKADYVALAASGSKYLGK